MSTIAAGSLRPAHKKASRQTKKVEETRGNSITCRGKSYKGRSRHFTSEDELARQTKDVKNWRRRDEEDDDDEDETTKKGSDEEDSEDEEDTGKATGVSKLIEVENPNHVVDKSHKVGALDVEAKPELTRRERQRQTSNSSCGGGKGGTGSKDDSRKSKGSQEETQITIS
eukprot:Seg1670.5 transcript_id=Seg1670.5/GoldUCD/mRNA.D3Y31 product="hypothetical protein" protein_id=Seg1670.5/GoldUCD/D3Y31